MSMPDFLVCSLIVNRLVRTRMLGGVGKADYTPTLTRLYIYADMQSISHLREA